MRPAGPARLAQPWLGLLAGVLCAIAIACGGAKSAMAPSTSSAMPAPAGGGAGSSREEIDELARKIDADLDAMGIARPAAPMSTCVQPPCGAEALSGAPRPAHTAEPDCRPGGGDVCRDSCRLSDSVCDSSGRICRIAGELGGGDAYANEKCASGKASCDAARTKCCGCL